MKGYQSKKSDIKQTLPNEGSSIIPPSNANHTIEDNTVAAGTNSVGDSKTINPPMAYGWVCPKCGRVNAPWKSTCDCYKGIAVPNTPPNMPQTVPYEPIPYYNPPIEIPNPFDPYGPYKWGDAPGWWNKGPTCKQAPSVGDPTFGNPKTMSNKINSQDGGDTNISAWNK